PVGTPICRNSLPGNTYSLVSPSGCVPIELFGFQGYGSGPQYVNGGPTTFSPQLLNYIDGTSFSDSTNVENDFAFNVTGEPFNDWAGPVSLAFGAEHRFDGISGKTDPLSFTTSQASLYPGQTPGWRQVNFLPVFGKIQVTEGYVETEVPILKDVPFAEN